MGAEGGVKVYLELPQPSRGLQRVKDALIRYAPNGVDIVTDRDGADLVILHVIGRNDQVRAAAQAAKRYAVIQYCLRSTMRPSTSAWLDIWQNAKLVWSYYDLPHLCAVDGEPAYGFQFYGAPLGSDQTQFRPPAHEDYRSMKVGVLSQSWLTEGVKEVVGAAKRVGATAWHVGPILNRGDVISVDNISDRHLRDYYIQTQFVACLRRVEGFEQPAVEALLCGARPILFDRAHYRRWFDGHAYFIPEGPREDVLESLVALFKAPRHWEVGKVEHAEIAAKFNWEPIIDGFGERALA